MYRENVTIFTKFKYLQDLMKVMKVKALTKKTE